jgi:FMN-dependent NADH-azoreductase
MKMAHNWTHEYPTGTPLMFIRDEILAKWERADREAAGEKVNYFADKMPSFDTDAMAAMKQPKQD